MIGRVERFEAPKVGQRAWSEQMQPDPSGLFVYFSAYQKLDEEAEKLREEQRSALVADMLPGLLRLDSSDPLPTPSKDENAA